MGKKEVKRKKTEVVKRSANAMRQKKTTVKQHNRKGSKPYRIKSYKRAKRRTDDQISRDLERSLRNIR